MGDPPDIHRLVRIAEATSKEVSDADAECGSAETCLETLSQLEQASVTVELLRDGKLGKRVRGLLDHSNTAIATAAAAVISSWKKKIRAITEGGGKSKPSASPNKLTSPKKSSSPVKDASRAQAPARPEDPGSTDAGGDVPTDAVGQQERNTANGKEASAKGRQDEASEAGGALQRQVSDQGGDRKRKRRPPFEKPQPVADPARNKLRTAMAEALIGAVEDDFEELDSPYMTSALIEQTVHDAYDQAGYRAQVRTILFNLKDKKNPDFRRRVLIGEVTPEEIADMKSEQMASDKKREENSNIRAYMQRETARTDDISTGNVTDMFKCGKCKKRRTTYYQMQTRSADEPMTTFVRCLECSHRWKFC